MDKSFIHILKDSLEQAKTQYKDLDYKSLYYLSSIHHVSPLVYNCLFENEDFPADLKKIWRKDVLTNVASQSLRSQIFLKVYHELLLENINVAVVKGIILRSLYPEPDFRPSNDEDIYIQVQDLDKVIEVFLNQGFKILHIKDNVTIVYNEYSGLVVEIHTCLFDNQSDYFKYYQKYFNNVFDHLIKFNISDYTVYSLSHNEHFLFLSFHLVKHILHSGVGMRQIMDLIVYYKHYASYIDWEYIYDIYKEVGIDIIMNNILSFAKDYYNLDDKDIIKYYQYTDDYEDLIEDILESGLYGKTSMERIHSANITISASNHKNTIIKSLFPSLKDMKIKYSYLNQYPYLIFIAWISRILSYIFNKQSGNKKETLDLGQKRVQLLKKYKVIK